MKQIVVISGKGGTGKTIVTASLSSLARNIVIADCDVDAADMHLLLAPEKTEQQLFKSGKTAVIDAEKCSHCGKCIELCRFDAISDDLNVDTVLCEGCGFCYSVCPNKAITMKENQTGVLFVSETRFGPMVHAKLGIAEENSGKLVSLVRSNAKRIGEEIGADWIIIDGSPGIGCPVIASISGVDTALVVTEPTMSGLHDADRVLQVARHFNVPVKLIINKYDLNFEVTDKIEEYCRDNKVALIGKIPFDKIVVESMVQGKTVIEVSKGKVFEEIKQIWDELKNSLQK